MTYCQELDFLQMHPEFMGRDVFEQALLFLLSVSRVNSKLLSS